ncbi:MAG: ABC transporter ATP-binding protein [Gammaproteobacteria bacterium]|nr:ABC transporter ATP-binding protein [Gammaproteobacteria bacterium]MCP4091571.1 ABC transporter ATP-binding protein [Gammaproteobacteria bacterium]MCP4276067.1 ABC transporter ATP-binding protein [Gammaproteobacteria bacterium]MCP4832559.1 ABC transporter ATP-binding protein [Gammaproteobacteria bacterium]MCP4929637.1 ABC transporter ATP-binding protein [Gammaproteobacteria bacterium]
MQTQAGLLQAMGFLSDFPVVMSKAQLTCKNLSVVINDHELIKSLTFDITPGSFVCILGTNGVGKTLTLHTLAGLREAKENSIYLCGDALNTLSRKEISKRLGMLLQIQEDTFPLTVLENAMMGCYPHMKMWQWPSKQDMKTVHHALETFDLLGLEQRTLAQLSGGERERAALATLMVQDPAIWLLDEPMNHLDPQHQLSVLHTLRQVAARGRIVIASLHNPAMAMRFADYALLLYDNGEWEFGEADELLEASRLQHLYQTPFDSFSNGNEQVLLPI